MKKLILLVALLTLVAFVSGAMAQEKAKATPGKAEKAAAALGKFAGAIDNVDAAAKTIVVKMKVKKEEKTMTFAIGDATKITKGKETLSFGDLKAGMDVAVDYKKEGDKNIAATIKVAAPKAAPKKK